MTDNQYQLTKKLYSILCELSNECYKDDNFNNELSEFIQFHNITNYSLEDIALVISKKMEQHENKPTIKSGIFKFLR